MTEVDLGIDGLTDYQVIGRGGFSTVFSAWDSGFRRRVAVKLLQSLDDAGRRRFDREREIMGRLSSHPNVVTAYRAGYTTMGAPYIEMEMLAGGSLQEMVANRGAVPWHEAVGYVIPALGALHHAHEQGILHRDVKPGNILVDGKVSKLTDFGIAAIRESTASQVGYTLAHCPPETFAQGQDARDERSDIYSMATTLFTLIAGRAPYDAVDDQDSQQAYMFRILDSAVPQLDPAVSVEPLRVSVHAAMSKDPTARPQTAAEFADQLLRIRAGGENAIVTSQPGSSPPALAVTSDPAPTMGQVPPTIGGVTSNPVGAGAGAGAGVGAGVGVGRSGTGPEPTGEHQPVLVGKPAPGGRRGPVLLALGALLALAVAGGVGWSFLGRSGDDGPVVAWQFETESSLASRPAIADDTLVIGAHVTHVVHAIDIVTGEQRWAYEAGAGIDASPLIVDDVVYIGSQAGVVHALELATGEVVWEQNLGDDVVAGAVVIDDVVFAATEEGEVSALDRADGDIAWTTPLGDGGLVNASLAVGHRDGAEVVIVGTTGGSLYLVDPVDGDIVEQIGLDGGVWFSAPLVIDRLEGDGEEVWVGTSTQRGGRLLRIDLDSSDVRSFSSSGGVGTAPVLATEELIVAGNDVGEVFAVDRVSLGEVWREGYTDGAQIKGSPAVAGDLVVFGTHDKQLVAVEATSGEERWRFEGEQIFGLSAPVVVDRQLYVGNDSGTVYRFDL